jgi:hypothetical protein
VDGRFALHSIFPLKERCTMFVVKPIVRPKRSNSNNSSSSLKKKKRKEVITVPLNLKMLIKFRGQSLMRAKLLLKNKKRATDNFYSGVSYLSVLTFVIRLVPSLR